MRKQFVHLLTAATLLLAGAPGVRGTDFRLQGDRITLRCDHAPLRRVLELFSRAGVSVRVDPELDMAISADAHGARIEPVLEEALTPLGYVLIWDVVEGPLGQIPRLAEMHVFKPGFEERMEPLFDPNANLEIASAPGRPEIVYVADEILIAVKNGTKLSQFQLLLDQIGGTVIDSCPELGIYRVRFLPGANIPAIVEQLAGNEIVHTAEPNYVVRVPSPAASPGSGGAAPIHPAGRPPEGAPSLAILDSGLLSMAGLDEAVVGRYDAMNPERTLGDTLGHGTQMAMIAAGAVAPDGTSGSAGESVPIVAVRAFDDNGRASNFGLMRSIEYALSQGTRVINLSWGSTVQSEFLANAIAYAQSKGMVVVAAAGNEPTGQNLYPAALPGVIAVSATTASDTPWAQSNYGDFVSFAAPGFAEFPIGHEGPPGSYAGTSISSAYLSRAIALYLARHPGASRSDVVAALQAAARDAGAEGRDPVYGYGLIDDEALARLLGSR